jgi:predicted metal-dependent hydrolase
MIHLLKFGSETILYSLEYSDRKTLGITVTPFMEVVVKAPVHTTKDKILQTIRNKAPWIIKQKAFFLTFHPKLPEKKFLSGETHYYLGRQYRLKVIKENSDSVKLSGKYLIVSTNNKDKVENLVKDWYVKHAKIKLLQISESLILQFQKYGVKPSEIKLRNMVSRWGSCTPKGKIILNPELIKAPKRCIEYVIIHELCHLVHHDHTGKFFDLQTIEMPDWKKWKMKLEQMMA